MTTSQLLIFLNGFCLPSPTPPYSCVIHASVLQPVKLHCVALYVPPPLSLLVPMYARHPLLLIVMVGKALQVIAMVGEVGNAL